ncbi:MAG: ABC transporter permease [Cyclobacteriaceae bacterium]|nr:ABC transporter permease [Cyclobacteriaceae bacterium]
MLSTFFQITFRNFLRRKFYFLLNLLGLSIGFAAFGALFLFTAYEASYDNFPGANRVFRIKGIRINQDGSSRESVYAPVAAGPDMKASFAEVEHETRIIKTVGMFRYADRWTKSEDVAYVNEDFFHVFSVSLQRGNADNALSQINTMVLSASFAKKVFGDEDPIGKRIDYKGRTYYEVVGVFPDFPKNSHVKLDALLSFKNYEAIMRKDIAQEPWRWDIPVTYLKISESAEAASLLSKIPKLVEEKTGEYLRSINQEFRIELQPVTSIHLESNLEGELGKNGDGKLVMYLKNIALVILVLALINYVSLSTAKSIERSREVGVRKVLGSGRGQLVLQFLGESIVLHGIALLVAAGILIIGQPYLPEFILPTQDLREVPLHFWLVLVTILLSGIFITGLYPAWLLSGYNPVNALKGTISGIGRGVSVRKVLVTMQFITSLVLIIWIFVVVGQLKFMRNTPLGFNTDRLVIRDSEVYDSLFDRNSALYKKELARIAGVEQVSYVGMLPGDHNLAYSSNVRTLNAPSGSAITLEFIMVDEHFDSTYGLEGLAGTGFKEESTPWKEIILNKSAMRAVGFTEPEEAIGERILFFNDTAKIVRVVEDFHFHSPREPVKPMAFLFVPHMGFYFTLNTEPAATSSVIQEAEKLFATIYPGQPFVYKMLDDHFNAQYNAELQFERLLYFFSTLSVCITCLGLLGMAAYTTHVRKKEIGIRKTLGASSLGILMLLWREYMVTILLASLIALPVSWYLASQWLMDFATRLSLTPALFVLPLTILMVITLATVLFQTLRAAMTNPVDSIRYE